MSRHLRYWGVWCLSRGSPPTDWRASCRISPISTWWRSLSSAAVPLYPASPHIPTQVSVRINKLYMHVQYISFLKNACKLITVALLFFIGLLQHYSLCFVGKRCNSSIFYTVRSSGLLHIIIYADCAHFVTLFHMLQYTFINIVHQTFIPNPNQNSVPPAVRPMVCSLIALNQLPSGNKESVGVQVVTDLCSYSHELLHKLVTIIKGQG